MQRTLKLFKLPETTKTPGFRVMRQSDIPGAHKLLMDVSVCFLVPFFDWWPLLLYFVFVHSISADLIWHLYLLKRILDTGLLHKTV